MEFDFIKYTQKNMVKNIEWRNSGDSWQTIMLTCERTHCNKMSITIVAIVTT